jgi:CubicO group peptidase (beta-lactamase class C family)
VKDYWHFAEALRGHVANPDQQILSEQMRLLLRSPQPFVDESETSWWMGGTDWGLGVAQVYDPQKTDYLDFKGNYYWSGGASTYFWIDPQNELVALMFTQVERNGQPNTFKWDFRNLVYEALTSPAEKAQ